ncbi:MAG: peptide-methionine (S)-S-oxide reductase MsrA [Dehalococcoidia bacterium]
MADSQETAILAAGCFWCIEPVFQQINGVYKVISGYTGGYIEEPSYELVCSGNTGHTEAIQILFDKNQVTYEQLLLLFFSIHDPTTLNRQGADIGTQYRSGIFYNSDEQRLDATNLVKSLTENNIWNSPIVTEITEYKKFYKAEEYHQNFYIKNPESQYCKLMIEPKIKKIKEKFPQLLKVV